MTDSHDERIKRARLALDGLSVGDALGCLPLTMLDKLQHYNIGDIQAKWTDDTNMALSIFSILRQFQRIDQDKLAHNFAAHFNISRGYAGGAIQLLTQVKLGADWRKISPTLFGQGSYGNGAAMRIAPLGAYFADDLPALIENAHLSSEITHAHPEGITAGIAVAVAAGFAWNLRGKTKPSRAEFIDMVLPHIPESDVKQNCIKARDLFSDLSIREIVKALGNGSKVTAQDTVPFVLYNAGEYLDDYERAIRETLSGGGDSDTTCAMVGGIVALYTGAGGIPERWVKTREALPAWAFEESSK